MRSNQKGLALSAIFFTFFTDTLCWSVVFPIFAPYFLDPGNGLFAANTPLAVKTTVFGVAVTAFSFGQLLGAPLLGAYADQKGAKRGLLIGILGTAFFLAATAWSIRFGELWLLLASRLATGLFAGNLSICLAAIGDLEEGEEKAKRFSQLSLAAGIAFVVGAFAGGKLSDPTIHHYLSFDLPLWIASGLSLLNGIYVAAAFRERPHEHHRTAFRLFESLRHLREAFTSPKLKEIYAVYFLFLFGWVLLMQFMPILAVERFRFTNANIADLAVYMGICWAVGAYLSKGLLCFFTSRSVLEGCLIAFMAFSAALLVPRHLWLILLIFGCSVVCGGLAWPLCTNLLSENAPHRSQGKILGLSQSVQSLALSLAPLLGGLAYHIHPGAPFAGAALAALLASLLYFLVLRK